MTLKSLQYFCEICKDLNISRASARIFVTQQCLSKAITNLETEFGCALFYRSRSGLQLTPKGQYLLARSQKILEYVHETSEVLTGGKPLHGLRIGLLIGTSTVLSSILPTAFAGESVTYKELPSGTLEAQVTSGLLDAAISLNPMRASCLHARPFCRIRLCAVVPSQHLLSDSQQISFRQLQGETLIVCSSHLDSYEAILRYCTEQGVTFKQTVSVATPFDALRLCRQNQGIGIFSKQAISYFQVHHPNTCILGICDLFWDTFFTLPAAAASGLEQRESSVKDDFFEYLLNQLTELPRTAIAPFY